MEKKVAVIADIHGNYSALKAVLNDIDVEDKIDHIYCLGDLVGIGYETNEVLELLLSRNDISYVMGNHDEAILDVLAGREVYSRGKEKEHHEWIAHRLNPKFVPFLTEIPVTLHAEINGKRVLFVHYHLNESGEFLSVDYEPTEEKLDKHYQSLNADIICFGHHHVIHHFKSKERLYLNPSSLGCYHKPLATFAILSFGELGQINVNMKEVPYDNKEFLLGYQKLDVPDADYLLKYFHGNQHIKYL